MSESIFYKSADNSNAQLYDKLKKKGKVNNREQELVKTSAKGIEIKANKSFLYENILQAISFIVTKIALMKKYSYLGDEELDILKPIRLKSRLININQRLLMIQKVMGSFDEIKEMAR
jgi:predicted AlkP superfamily pyrophosphatase or phosphodiesterase